MPHCVIIERVISTYGRDTWLPSSVISIGSPGCWLANRISELVNCDETPAWMRHLRFFGAEP